MRALKSDLLPVRLEEDVVKVRQATRSMAVNVGFSLVDQTKVITAASEIARNTIVYGGGGTATIEMVEADARKGIRLLFEDNGPGIENIELALTDGYTSGKGLGLGLSGAKRLCSEFNIQSRPGEGTKITLIRWKP